MELYYVVTILDRDRRTQMEKIYRDLDLKVALTMMGRGTAPLELLTGTGLSQEEKAVMTTVADRAGMKKLMLETKRRLYIDIPGNGIMAAVPIKSVGGAQTLALLSNDQPKTPEKPDMKFDYELIYVILNEGHSDEVMDAARPAGARGGTVIAAKGTGIAVTEKFRGLTLASEKEVVLIVAASAAKGAIMRAIIENAGIDTPAGAICFSLPVSEVAGLRLLDMDME